MYLYRNLSLVICINNYTCISPDLMVDYSTEFISNHSAENNLGIVIDTSTVYNVPL